MLVFGSKCLSRDLETTGQVFCSPLYKLLVFQVLLGLRGVAVSSLMGLHDRVLVSVVTTFFRSGHVTLPSQRYSVKFFHVGLRVSLSMCELLTSLQWRSAPRSSRNCACARSTVCCCVVLCCVVLCCVVLCCVVLCCVVLCCVVLCCVVLCCAGGCTLE